MTDYNIEQVTSNFYKISDIELESSGTFRKIFRGGLIGQNPKDPKAKVTGYLITQRKSPKQGWEDISSLKLSNLRSGEGIKYQLSSTVLKKLVQEIYNLYKVSKQDLKWFKTDLSVVPESEMIRVDTKRKSIIKLLIDQNYSNEILAEIINSKPALATKFANSRIIETRRRNVITFGKIQQPTNLQLYKKLIMKNPRTKDETALQHFFANNIWIFGLGLDYKFKGILQKEFSASNTEADGTNEVISDFLLGDKKFTTFVEIKKPDTDLFGAEKNRSNCWRLSNELIDSVSQILEQKASGQIKIESNQLHDDSGKIIIQKAYDSKVVLIIGSWNQLNKCTDKEKQIKEKTFELFRQNLKNIEIVTYDELLDRAKQIAEVAE
jgi:hypothetical protein